MQYSRAFIFSKHTDLLPYFRAHYNGINISDDEYGNIKARYAAERDVKLILLIRRDGMKTICRIKCPINPLPIRGEFEVTCVYDVCECLRQLGWVHKEVVDLSMFR